MRKHVPNILTSMNILAGSLACVSAIRGEFVWVLYLIIIAGVFDFLDGFSSRLLDAYSALGKELDSLADVVSFGLAPSLAIFSFLRKALEQASGFQEYLPYLSFSIVIFSALRLAKFNTDERQVASFVGLNTPSNALFWVGYCAGVEKFLPSESTFIVAITLLLLPLFCYLLIAELPMFSLKSSRKEKRYNGYIAIQMLLSLAAVLFLGVLGVSVAVLLYIFLCVILQIQHQRKN